MVEHLKVKNYILKLNSCQATCYNVVYVESYSNSISRSYQYNRLKLLASWNPGYISFQFEVFQAAYGGFFCTCSCATLYALINELYLQKKITHSTFTKKFYPYPITHKPHTHTTSYKPLPRCCHWALITPISSSFFFLLPYPLVLLATFSSHTSPFVLVSPSVEQLHG